MTITITGTVRLPNGDTHDDAQIIIRRLGSVVAQSGGVMLPSEWTVDTDATGDVSFTIEPGSYVAFSDTDFGRQQWTFTVDETPSTQDWADRVQAADPVITPALVQQAIDARDAAELAQDGAEAAETAAEAARDVAVAASAALALAGSPYGFETVDDLAADAVLAYSGPPPAVVVAAGLKIFADMYRYEVLGAGAVSWDIQTAGGVKLALDYVPAETGSGALGTAGTAASLLAAPAFLQFKSGHLRAADIGLKTGASNDDANVTAMDAIIADISGGEISRLSFGPGSFYFSNTIDDLAASNFTIEGMQRGATSLILSSDTGSHRGKFIKLGGFASIYRFTATAGQTNFVGLSNSGETLTFTVSSVVTVQINGEDILDFSVNVGTQTVTLTVGAALNDVVRIEVSAATYGRIKVRGFTISCLSGTADQTNQFFNLGAISDLEVSDIRVLSNVGGLIRAGYEGTVARTSFRDITGNIDPTNSITVIDLVQCGRFELNNVVLTGSRGAGTKTGQMIRLKPETGSSIDTFRMEYCALYCMDGVNRNMEIDMTDGSVTNLWMNYVTFDQGKINNIRMIDGAAATARWARNFFLRDCYFRLTRESPDVSARNINVEISGANTRVDNFDFSGLLGFGPASAVRVSKTNAGSKVQGFKIHHTEFAHQNTDPGATPVTACVDIAAEGVTVKDCFVAPAFHSSTVRVNYLARTTAGVDGFEVSGNRNFECLLGDFLHTTYAAASERRMVGGNSKPTLRAYPTSTGSNNFGNKTHAVNRAGKYLGKIEFNSTTGFPVYAAGPLDTDPWKFCHDNTTLVTPS